jgi:iron complex transport system ATP-binding protein
MTAAISIERLSFGYTPDQTVLREIGLEIPSGAVTAILGPNGSGKTTLMHLVLGLLTAEEGEIRLAGRPHAAYDHRDLSRLLGLVPQNEPLSFNLNVLEYVLLGRAPYLTLLQRPSAHDREVAFAALETVGIAPLWERSVLALSGGEQQLATLARALTQEPRILLLDEPTSHLDVGNARRIMSIIRRLQGRGQTVLFTTHDPNAAAATADYIVLMREGRVLQHGPTSQILTEGHLTATYDVAIEVLEDRRARPLVVVY